MKIITVAKYIDQPAVLSKLHSFMPQVLVGTGAGVWGYESFYKNRNSEHKTQKAFKNAVTISSAVGASYVGARGLKVKNKTFFKGLLDYIPLKSILEKQSLVIDSFLKNNVVEDERFVRTLKNAKNRQFKLSEIEILTESMPKNKQVKELLNKILPEPENLSSKEIFSEIKRLSLIGLIPVAGGVAGGVMSDVITNTQSKKSSANKIKEGVYQYLANIFLCNVGAGAALYASEKMVRNKILKPLTPLKKLGVIMSGITLTGIMGGSIIANFISKKIIDPLFGKKYQKGGIYSERKPEPLDIVLHADDIATAGVLSGFKWIEPALPVMYFISGYRAGIGYRNNFGKNTSKK